MKTSNFDYDLPEELIAQAPLPERSASRMLTLARDSGAIGHRSVLDLPEFLRKGDLLVVNDTRVFPARLSGRRKTGGYVEVLFIEETDVNIWRVLLKTSNSLKENEWVALGRGRVRISVKRKLEDASFLLEVRSDLPLMEILEEEGVPPLPPYIKRAPGYLPVDDKQRYQTIYARHTGAVAAPTAGLHFTPELLADIEAKGVTHTSLTLHVGPGTFRPVKTINVEQHKMDTERYSLSEEAASLLNATRANNGRIVAVGSTVVRTLETLVRMNNGVFTPTSGSTDIFIYPPFQFKAVDVLVTNFHLPKSSLIMMVSAFAGHDSVMRAYKVAVEERYRFFSYGDCMFIC